MKNQISLALKGFAMGCADVVPGVSGGTIALLTGIYQRLIDAISSVDVKAFKLLFSLKIKELWGKVDGTFLVILFLGIITAIVSLSHSIKYALSEHPVLTWSFFFGLIIASAILIIKNIEGKKTGNYFWFVPGAIIGFFIAIQTSIPFFQGDLAVFLAAMIAISAMILPGISGSFILILLGMYEPILNAVTERNLGLIVIFICGAVLGLLLFSRVIKWLLGRFYQATLFFLSGLMIGSLVKIWPWKISQTGTLDLVNVLPASHPEPQTLIAIVLMLFSIVIVFTIDFLGKKYLVD